jgi:hypothetical protein
VQTINFAFVKEISDKKENLKRRHAPLIELKRLTSTMVSDCVVRTKEDILKVRELSDCLDRVSS